MKKCYDKKLCVEKWVFQHPANASIGWNGGGAAAAPPYQSKTILVVF